MGSQPSLFGGRDSVLLVGGTKYRQDPLMKWASAFKKKREKMRATHNDPTKRCLKGCVFAHDD